ncbi:MAG TPA: hypothetical protein VM864_08550 [Pyrinomonadaceae bacterium]|nr:hypothetical protein [Pyrinomonadaceae bacterium]
MHDEQKELFEILVAGSLNILFLALIAPLLWALGSPALALRLARGYGVLWIVIFLTGGVLVRAQEFFRVNLYDHPDAFVNSNLAASCLLQAGWSAFAALAVHHLVAGAPVWLALILHLTGFLSCLFAFFAVSSFYQGHIYKFISLPLALVCYVVFSAWTPSARALFGWFFDLFDRRAAAP